MAVKTLTTRVQQKSDTSANWAKATNFTPLKGEIIVYTDLQKIKIGDGVTKVGALEFANSKDAETLTGASLSTILNSSDVEIPTSKAVSDALNGKLDKVDAGSDWNQSDNTKPDYIKNRPFYKDVKILDSIDVDISWDGDTTGRTASSQNRFYKVSDSIFTEEQFLQMYFICNGSEIAMSSPDVLNSNSKVLSYMDSGGPVIAVDIGGSIPGGPPDVFPETGVYFPSDGSVTRLFSKESILSTETVLKKIDEEFIPDNVLHFKNEINNKLDSKNPNAFGSFSMGRKYPSVIGENSYAAGIATIASGNASHAEGKDTTASGSSSHAEGDGTTASGVNSHSEGNGTIASGYYSHAEGLSTTASGYYSHAEGEGTIASSPHQHVQGYYNLEDKANKYAHIVGNGDGPPFRSNAHTLDWSGNAWYAGKVSIGTTSNVPAPTDVNDLVTKQYVDNKFSTKTESVTSVNGQTGDVDARSDWNQNDETQPDYIKNRPFYESISLTAFLEEQQINFSSSFTIPNSIVQGKTYFIHWDDTEYTIEATGKDIFGDGSILIPYLEQADGLFTIEGSVMDAADKGIHNVEIYTTELSIKTIDEKFIPDTIARKDDFVVRSVGGHLPDSNGNVNVNYYDVIDKPPIKRGSGTESIMQLGATEASGGGSHAEGSLTTSSGMYSHAEGVSTEASGEGSHAEGEYTKSIGTYSHSEGSSTRAIGLGSHAEGSSCSSTGKFSHAEGYGTVASSDYQHVEGKFNIEDSAGNYANIVGNGEPKSDRSNAHTLDWNGNAWFAGDVYTGSTSGTNKDEGSKKLATEEYVDSKQLQPDWNQNDETAADYIKNRPFYTGDTVETVLVEQNTASFAEHNGLYGVEFPSTFEATVGETYKVSWDGTVYECTCKNFNGELFMGNLSIAGEGSDTGEPFIMFVYNGEGIAIVTADTSASHTFSISALVTEVVKIDPKYIRDMYYTADPVEIVLVEERTVAFADSSNGFYRGQLKSTFSATVGDTYKVSWDGASYECTCVLIKNLPAIGNPSIMSAGSDTGEPFLIGVDNGKRIDILTADTSASHTVSISGFVQEIVKIDEKYLPNTIATKSEVEVAQTTAENAQITASNAQTTASNAKSEALYLAARMFGHTSVVDNAFNNDKTLSITSLPACIESIGASAFYGCTKLALTSLPSGLTSIGANAFSGCTKLALTSLPSGITSIGANAFQDCTGLTSITFTGKPTTISSSAFAGCTNLTTINVPWAEGEVANSPWGATNATINYNYTEV